MFDRPKRLLVGAAGRLSPEKGFGVLLDAADHIRKVDPTVGVIHFGDGPLRADLQRHLTRRGLTGDFVFAGYRTDLDHYLPAFDCFVLPSFTEGLPNVVLEAFAAGVAVVATRVGGTPEVVEDGVNGYLVPPGDPAALAGRIVEILSADARRKAMARRGRARVRDYFTFEGQAQKYLRLFEALTGIGLPRQSEVVPRPLRAG
jgi:glycosyltransferase involved in cell wall biosynthesis